jgi:DNA-binding transcriptional MerR regulator
MYKWYVHAMAESEPGFVVEELSRRTGITVRSLRSYQSRKLLPPPEVRGRTGYYDERHVARIELIKDLQSEGFKLESIARMLDEGGRSDADLLRFTRSVKGLFSSSEGSITSVEEVGDRFGVAADAVPGVVARAEKLGLVRQVSEVTYEEVAPRLLAAGEQAVKVLGLDALAALDVVGQLRKHSEGVARVYLDLFVRMVWEPFVAAGQPHEQWRGVQEALDEVSNLATEALVGAFELVMVEQIDARFGREIMRERRPRSGRGRDR